MLGAGGSAAGVGAGAGDGAAAGGSGAAAACCCDEEADVAELLVVVGCSCDWTAAAFGGAGEEKGAAAAAGSTRARAWRRTRLRLTRPPRWHACWWQQSAALGGQCGIWLGRRCGSAAWPQNRRDAVRPRRPSRGRRRAPFRSPLRSLARSGTTCCLTARTTAVVVRRQPAAGARGAGLCPVCTCDRARFYHRSRAILFGRAGPTSNRLSPPDARRWHSSRLLIRG